MPCFAPKFENIKKMSAAQNYAIDYLTAPWCFPSLPHVSIPMKSKSLPIGMSLVCNAFDDEKLLAASRLVEEVLNK